MSAPGNQSAVPSHPSSLSMSQMRAIEVVERTMSVISILGCLFIILSFLLCDSLKKKTFNRLLFLASWGNLLSNVATLIGPTGPRLGSQSLTCKAQATLIQWFMPADCLWTFCMAVNVFLTFQTTKVNINLKKLEKWYFLFCFGIPAIPALTYFGLDLTRGTDYYGNATLWCWISRKHENLRLISFYGPVWVMIVITMGLYAITGRAIYKGQVKNKLMQNALDNDEASFRSDSPTLNVITRTEISQFSEPVLGDISHRSSTQVDSDCGSISSAPRPKFIPIRVPGFGDGSQSPPGTATALTPPSTPPALHPSAAMSPKITTTITTHPTSPLTPISPSSRPFPFPSRHSSFASASIRPGKRSESTRRTNRGAKTYAQVAFLLYVAMLAVWVPSTANRVYGVVSSGKGVNFGLSVAAAIVLPLQGFFNTLIYLFTSRRELFGGRKKDARTGTSDLDLPRKCELKQAWHRPESREELVVVVEDEDDKEYVNGELRFPWSADKKTAPKSRHVEIV